MTQGCYFFNPSGRLLVRLGSLFKSFPCNARQRFISKRYHLNSPHTILHSSPFKKARAWWYPRRLFAVCALWKNSTSRKALLSVALWWVTGYVGERHRDWGKRIAARQLQIFFLPFLSFKQWTRAIFRKRKLRNFQHGSFCKGKTRTEQWRATSRSYWVSWIFIRSSAILNLFAGWDEPEPQCSM